MNSTPICTVPKRPRPQSAAPFQSARPRPRRDGRTASFTGLVVGLGLLVAAPSLAAGAAAFNCETTSFFTRNRASTVIVGIASNNTDGIRGAAQLFDAPEPLTLRGFGFYGIMGFTGLPVNVTASVYLPDEEGFPTGSPLATTTVTVDDVFGPLEEMRQEAVFDVPVEISEPYLLVLENDSSLGYRLGISDLEQNDGEGDGLSRMFFNGRWRNGLDVSFGGSPFDADFVVFPDYSVDLEVELSAPAACLDGPGSLEFQASGSPILTSRFYNFDPSTAFQWIFGDLSPVEAGEMVTHDYASAGPWLVELVGVLSSGGGEGCTVRDQGHVGRAPQNLELGFVEDFGALSVAFTAEAEAADAWTWDFGDGGSSTEQNPTYTYGSLGLFTACVGAGNLCGETAAPGVCADVLSPFVDLAVGLASTSSVIDPGATVTYTVSVTNTSGVPSGAQTVSHTIPSNLTGAVWSCAVSGGGSCTSAGAGSINETILLDSGATLVYTVEGVFEPADLESLTLAVQASTPAGDPTANNDAELVILSSAAVIFMDGFESGSTEAWTSTVEPAEPVEP